MKFFVIVLACLLLTFPIYADDITWIPFHSGATEPASPEMISLTTTSDGVVFTYQIPGMFVSKVRVENENFDNISIPGWGRILDEGKPAVPSLARYVAVPQGASVSVRVMDDDPMILNGYYLFPSQPLAIDSDNYPEPEFTIDRDFYGLDTNYPSNIAGEGEEVVVRGVTAARIMVNPIQYNPQKRQLTVHRRFTVEVRFSNAGDYFSDTRLRSPYYEPLYKSILLNYSELGPAPQLPNYSPRSNGADMIILTKNAYKPAADSLAAWKNLLGLITKVYTVEEVGNSSTAIKNFMQTAYDTWNPAPSFLLIIGDHPEVTSYMSSLSGSHVTDLYYQKLDGPDYFPDIGCGRISITNLTEAMKQVQNIIKYEKDPVTDPNFWINTAHAAYFQHAGGGYAQRRFAQTSEEIVTHLNNLGYSPERIFYTSPSVNPTHWNNGYYSNGEPIPPYLLRANGFQWNGNATDISNEVNNGVFLLTHRDHGSETGWGDPNYTVSHVNALQNGDKLPVVFSINCLTGRFDYSGVCFAEAWQRNPNGGAIGVIAASEVSYSGCNDGFAEGLVDAIWPSLVPLFPHNMNPTVTPHDPIYRMGLVLNQGKFRMTETWGSGNPPFNYEEYTFELFHWFGDPSLEIRTAVPQNFVVSHPPTIIMGSATFDVNVDADSAIVVITRNGEIVGTGMSQNGQAQVVFNNPIVTPDLLDMVIYKHNYIPYITTLQPIAATGPYLYTMGTVVIDSLLNGNGIPESGETIGLKLQITNLGVQAATNITGTITTTDTCLNILDATTSIAFIDTADTIVGGNFTIEISPNTPHLHSCPIDLHLEADGGYTWDQTLFLKVREGARIVLQQNHLNFPNTFLNFTTTLTLDVQNTGVDTLFISDILSDIPQYAATQTTLMIPPGSQDAIEIGFTPDTTQTYNGTITIKNSDPLNFSQTFTVSGTGIYAPDIQYPDSVTAIVGVTDTVVKIIDIQNLGLGELTYNVQIAGYDPNNGNEGAGGSDAYGYMWVDSDEPNGPDFQWIDITGTGTQVALTGNNSISDKLTIGFPFNFYGVEYNDLRVCTNGWLSFTTFSVAYNNVNLPSLLAPRAMIAPLWDDLLFQADSKLYFEDQGTKAVILFEDVYRVTGEGPYTFEVLLYDNGNMVLQYLSLNTLVDDYTVGIQNHQADDGLTIAYNESYLHDSLAVLISRHSWVSVSPLSGVIAAQGSEQLTLTFATHEFPQGDFWASLQIESNDPDEGLVQIPIHMIVTVTGLEDGEEIAAQDFRLYQNAPNPFNPSTVIAYSLPRSADVELVIYNMLGQKVKTLVKGKQTAKRYRVQWDGTNDRGVKVASGIYIYRLRAGDRIATRKMILMK